MDDTLEPRSAPTRDQQDLRDRLADVRRATALARAIPGSSVLLRDEVGSTFVVAPAGTGVAELDLAGNEPRIRVTPDRFGTALALALETAELDPIEDALGGPVIGALGVMLLAPGRSSTDLGGGVYRVASDSGVVDLFCSLMSPPRARLVLEAALADPSLRKLRRPWSDGRLDFLADGLSAVSFGVWGWAPRERHRLDREINRPQPHPLVRLAAGVVGT